MIYFNHHRHHRLVEKKIRSRHADQGIRYAPATERRTETPRKTYFALFGGFFLNSFGVLLPDIVVEEEVAIEDFR